LRAQGLRAQSYEDASGERRTVVGSGTKEDRWICVRDRVSGPRKKRIENLGVGIVRLREGDIPTAGGSVGHSRTQVEHRW
jgi:hypothetical protein